MGNLLLIDKSSSCIRDYKKSLKDKGWRLSNVQNIKETLPLLKNKKTDLIIVDSSASSAFSGSATFKKFSTPIPKLILQDRHNPKKGKNPWLKHNLAFPVSDELTFDELMHWIKELSQYRALGIENETLRDGLKHKSKVSTLHGDIRKTLYAESDTGVILRSILKIIKKLTGAGAGSLLISDEPFFEMLKLRNSSMIRKQVFKMGTGIAGAVMEKGIALNIKDVQGDKRYDKTADSLGYVKVRALLCVPVIIHDRVVGVIRLINSNNKEVFSDDDMNLLEHGADYAAIVIERAYLYEKLKNDELTSLYNMNYIRQAIDQEIERSRRFNSVFSLLFMDMDNFKRVNDRYGHLVGSRVIVEIAQLIQENVRKLDIVSRYGGDEFVIILPQTSREVSFLVAERLRRLIEKNVFIENDSYSIRLTASFGVASYPYNAKKKEELLRLADKAMYSGKFLTKNIVFEAK